MTESNTTVHPARQKRVRGALKGFSIAAYATGVMLLVLVVEMILKYGVFRADTPDWLDSAGLIIAQVHGLLYFIFLITIVNLGQKARWSPGKWMVTALGGVVPFLSFYVEKKRREEVVAQFQLDKLN